MICRGLSGCLLLAMFAFLNLISNAALASEGSQSNQVCETYSSNLKKLQWFAAELNQITNAPCVRTTPFTNQEMTDFLISKVPDVEKVEDRTINGIAFKGEHPYLLNLFADLHTNYEYHKLTNPKLSSKCQKVICAVNEIYGEPQGTQLLFMLGKFGFNGSRVRELQPENYSPLRKEELDDILMSLDSLPPRIYPIDYNRPLLKFARGYMRPEDDDGDPDTHVLANSKIELFDSWSRSNRQQRMMVIIHETAHVLAKDNDEKTPWTAVSGWTRKPQPDGQEEWINSNPKKVPSIYAGTNPAEDFAESLVGYRFNPKQLNKKFTSRYDHIGKNYFNDVEFTSAEQCRGEWDKDKADQAKRIQEQLALQDRRTRDRSEAQRLIGSMKIPFSRDLTPNESKRVMNACANDLISDAVEKTSRGQACVRQQVGRIAIQDQANKMGARLNLRDISATQINQVPVSERTLTKARAQAQAELADGLNQTFQESLIYWASETPEECKSISAYLNLGLFTQQIPALRAPNGEPRNEQSLRRLLAKACETNLNSFAGSILPQPMNIFAGNPFQKILK